MTITTNHSTARYREDGIMNGAGGYIDYIQTSKKDPDRVEIIWVKFDHFFFEYFWYKNERNNGVDLV